MGVAGGTTTTNATGETTVKQQHCDFGNRHVALPPSVSSLRRPPTSAVWSAPAAPALCASPASDGGLATQPIVSLVGAALGCADALAEAAYALPMQRGVVGGGGESTSHALGDTRRRGDPRSALVGPRAAPRAREAAPATSGGRRRGRRLVAPRRRCRQEALLPSPLPPPQSHAPAGHSL